MTTRPWIARSRRALGGWALLGAAAIAFAGCGGPGGAGGVEAVQADGAAVFAANCAICHGPEGEGTRIGPPLVHVVYEPGHHSDESFRAAIQRGSPAHHWEFGPMPPQPQVAEHEIDAVIGHVRGLQREAGIID